MEKNNLIGEIINDSLRGLIIISENEILYINPEVYGIIGYSENDFKSKNNFSEILNLIHQDERGNIANVMKNGENIYSTTKIRILQKNKTYKTVGCIIETFNHSKKNALKIILSDLDKTQFKLSYRDYQFKNFIENTNESILFLELSEPIDINRPVQEIIKLIYERGYISFCNKKFVEMYGYPKKEKLENMSIRSIYCKDESESFISIFQKFIESGFKLKDYEIVYRPKEGVNLNFSCNLVGIIEDGLLKGIWSSQLDITQRKKSEKLKDAFFKITESTNAVRNLDELFSILHEIVWRFMPAKNFYIALFNPEKNTLSFPYFKDEYEKNVTEAKFEKGLTEYVIRTGMPLLATPEIFDTLLEIGEVELIGENSIDWLGVPLKIQNQSKGAIVVQSYNQQVRYNEEDLKILSLVAEYAAMAIERKMNEEIIIANEKRYQAFIEQSLEGIYYVNYPKPIDISLPAEEQAQLMYDTGIIMDCNDLFAKMYGKSSKDDIIGIEINKLYLIEGRNENIKSLVEFIKNGYIGRNLITSEINEKGEYLFFQNNVSGTIEDGFLTSSWGTQIDITEQKKAEKNYEIINELLEAASGAEEILLIEQNFSRGIKYALSKIGSVLNTEEVCICENIYDIERKKHLIKENNYWVENTINENLQHSETELIEFPMRWFEELYKSNVLNLNIKNIPDGKEKEILLKWKVQNVLLIPIIIKEILWGFVRFKNIKFNGLWEDSEISILRSLANAIGGAINKERTEKLLKENESRIRGILTALPDIMFVLDENQTFIDYYANSTEVMKIKPDKFLYKKVEDVFSKDLAESIISALSKAKETKNIKVVEYETETNNQKVYYEGRIVYCADNKFIIVVRDVTDRRSNEKEIEMLYKAIEQSPAMVMITNKDNIIEYVNNKFTEVTGYEKEDVLYKNADNFRNLSKTDDTYTFMKNALSNGAVWHGEYINKKKNGELYWEYESISPIKDEKNNIINFIAIKEDITERKQMMQEIIEAKEKAEESVKLKTNFLANMSHELRTPLHGILGFSQLLSESSDNPEIKMMSDTIYTSSTRLLDTLNSILNLSKTESETFELNLEETSVNEIISEVAESFKESAKAKRLYLKTFFLFDSVVAMLDKRLFKEIMTNLIKNAIKYTERGGIIIESLIKNEYLEINVRDTGIGIPRDKYKVIFEEFRQESEGYSRSFEGTGLGLTLAKRYAELMRGNISVKSELGVGSVFTVRLPLRSERKGFIPNGLLKEENLKDETPKDELRKILLVENDKINANLIRLYLRNLYDVTLAVNGNEALELTSKNKYDAILMDINLGESINGVEVTKIIRKKPDYKNTPIIAVTAFAMKGDKEEFFEAGLNYYIAKPFYKSKLIGLLDSIFNPKGK